jgi:hypothetical protein
MADNVTITEGSGTQIAADEVAGVKYQRVKISIGEDGVANDISTANPIPVSITNTSPLEVIVNGVETWLKTIVQVLQYPNYLDRTINAIRVAVINTIGTVTTVSTVTTVTTTTTLTNQTNIGNYTADVQNYAGLRTAWSQTVRGRIT